MICHSAFVCYQIHSLQAIEDSPQEQQIETAPVVYDNCISDYEENFSDDFSDFDSDSDSEVSYSFCFFSWLRQLNFFFFFCNKCEDFVGWYCPSKFN